MSRYDDPTILKTSQNVPYEKGRFYPNIPLSASDIYIITTIGDRLDYLAYSYYRDVNLWWVISMANNNITRGSIFPQPGTQLRIPIDINIVLDLFNSENNL